MLVSPKEGLMLEGGVKDPSFQPVQLKKKRKIKKMRLKHHYLVFSFSTCKAQIFPENIFSMVKKKERNPM